MMLTMRLRPYALRRSSFVTRALSFNRIGPSLPGFLLRYEKRHLRLASGAFSFSSLSDMSLPASALNTTPGAKPHPDESPLAPTPVVVNLHLDALLVQFLQTKQRKTRMLVSGKKVETLSLAGLRDLVERRLPFLKDQPYRLAWRFPDQDAAEPLASSQQWVAALQAAQATNESLVLLVRRTPGVFPPPSWVRPLEESAAGETSPASRLLGGIDGEEEILRELAAVDPDESAGYALVSFYRFVAIADLQAAAESLERLWRPFGALGRIYVAHEGVNAQMAVPDNVLELFCAATKRHGLLRDVPVNVDERLTREAYANATPFRALHVRPRAQIVADGLPEALDWSRAGTELSGLQWHEALDAVGGRGGAVLDCRNIYETDVGIFDHAEPLNTTFFRESWAALDERLQHVDRDAPILTYCTGGIRCVKINAYLEQKLGFRNTYRLKGGVIAYHRELRRVQAELAQAQPTDAADAAPEAFARDAARFYPAAPEVSVDASRGVVEVRAPSLAPAATQAAPSPVAVERLASKFRGVNYVFDDRMGARVTDDVLGQCDTCGAPCDAYVNCRSDDCNLRFLQCAACAPLWHACCSQACRAARAAQDERRADKARHQSERRQLQMLSRAAKLQQLQQLQQQSARTAKAATADAAGASFRDHALVGSTASTAAPGDAAGDAVFSARVQAQLGDYCEALSVPEPPTLAALREETQRCYPANVARMLSSPSQGALLSLLASLQRAERVLELGSFTGYATLWLSRDFGRDATDDAAAAAPGRVVYSCDVDDAAAAVAARYFERAYGAAAERHIVFRRESAEETLQRARREQLRFDM